MKILPPNSEKWAETLQEKFYEDYPELMNFPVSIKFLNKNINKGMATGSIKIASNFHVPFVIDKGKLHDLDVAVVNGTTIPLTTETLSEMLQNPSAFEGAESPRISKDSLERLFVPELTYPENQYNIMHKTGEFLERVLQTIDEKSKEFIKQAFTSKDIIEFNKNETIDILKNILDQPVKEFNLTKFASDSLDRDRQYVHKVSKNKYRLYQGNSVVEDTQTLDLNEEEALKFNNKYAEAIEESILEDAKLVRSKADIQVGKTGVILDQEKTAFIKIAVKRDLTIDGERVFMGMDGYNPVRVSIGPVKAITKVSEHSYIVPENFDFYEEKYISAKIPNVKHIHTVSKDDNDLYTFKGAEFKDKNLSSLNQEQANWVAISYGVSEPDFNKMQHMRKKATIEFTQSNISAPVPLKNVVKELEKRSEEKQKSLNSIKNLVPSIFKAAAYLKDPQTLNGVLSLGIMNEKNINEYANNVPIFQAVSNKLAHLLLAARVDNTIIDQTSIKEAMVSLTKIAFQLRNLNKSIKNSKR